MLFTKQNKELEKNVDLYDMFWKFKVVLNIYNFEASICPFPRGVAAGERCIPLDANEYYTKIDLKTHEFDIKRFFVHNFEVFEMFSIFETKTYPGVRPRDLAERP